MDLGITGSSGVNREGESALGECSYSGIAVGTV